MPSPAIGEGSSARALAPQHQPSAHSLRQGRQPLHPLRGERQIRASSAEIGEGSSAQPTLKRARCVGEVLRLFTLSEGRGRFGRLRPKPVRGLPVETPCTTPTVVPPQSRGLRLSSHPVGEG